MRLVRATSELLCWLGTARSLLDFPPPCLLGSGCRRNWITFNRKKASYP